ncbi:hypothetical protein Q7C36_016771 [Tachysurus vachellii]|uniref:Uncharacterized protein n=1 Tax=Tachysurus vachellii TaxID=175792 RepID=A0AA88S9P4_TACVA|nr:hypothetical protein Q7C36_016771 [Tachysurus vachellii]
MSHEEMDGGSLGHNTTWMFQRGGDTDMERQCWIQPAKAIGSIPAIFQHCQILVDLEASETENPVNDETVSKTNMKKQKSKWQAKHMLKTLGDL